MRLNDDGKTVRAMDVLVPQIGEIIGGSQREERYDVLVDRMQARGMRAEDYAWYLELRKYGTAPHSGFGLGFERLVLFATGDGEHPRRVIPLPAHAGARGVLGQGGLGAEAADAGHAEGAAAAVGAGRVHLSAICEQVTAIAASRIQATPWGSNAVGSSPEGSRSSLRSRRRACKGRGPSLQGSAPSLRRVEVEPCKGRRRSLQGSRSSFEGSHSSLQGSGPSLQGSRSSPEGSRSSLQGSRSSLQGSRSSLQGSGSSLARVEVGP